MFSAVSLRGAHSRTTGRPCLRKPSPPIVKPHPPHPPPSRLSVLCCAVIFFLPLPLALGNLQQGFLLRHTPTFFCSPRDHTYEFIAAFVLTSALSALALSAMMLHLQAAIQVRERERERERERGRERERRERGRGRERETERERERERERLIPFMALVAFLPHHQSLSTHSPL